ncbi:MAG: hypothetical protein ABWY55_12880 [Microbacterium sp.]
MMRGRMATMLAGATLVASAGILTGCTAPAPDAAPDAARFPTPTPSAPCIVGSWSAHADQLQPAYDAIPGGLDYPLATIDPTASAMLEFDVDGSFRFTQDVPATVSWLEHVASVRLGGAMTGTYVATGSALSLDAEANDLVVAPADDQSASALFAAATQETLGEWPVSASGFTCDADALVIDLETEGHRASVSFARGT